MEEWIILVNLASHYNSDLNLKKIVTEFEFNCRIQNIPSILYQFLCGAYTERTQASFGIHMSKEGFLDGTGGQGNF